MAGLIACAWIACGVAGAGFFYAQQATECDRSCLWTTRERAELKREALTRSLAFGCLGGPLSLVIVLALTGCGQYGWRLHG